MDVIIFLIVALLGMAWLDRPRPRRDDLWYLGPTMEQQRKRRKGR